MQWSTEPHAGFTKNAKPVLPVISEGPFSYQLVNVAHQRRDPNSLLNWMERVIRMRKEVPEIGWGDFAILNTHAADVLAIFHSWNGETTPYLSCITFPAKRTPLTWTSRQVPKAP